MSSPLSPLRSIASPLSASAQAQEDSSVVPSSQLGLDTLSAVAAADSYSFPLSDSTTTRNTIQLPPISRQVPSPSLLPQVESSHVSMPPRSPAIASQRNNLDVLLQSIDPTLNAGTSLLGSPNAPLIARPSSSNVNIAEDEHEIAFLIRHYAEVPGYG